MRQILLQNATAMLLQNATVITNCDSFITKCDIYYKLRQYNTFHHSQFFIEGFSTPYRLDRDSNDGGILLYVREDIPSNLIAIENKAIESFFVKVNLRNDKWLINCSYNHHKNLIDNHLDVLSKYLIYIPQNMRRY